MFRIFSKEYSLWSYRVYDHPFSFCQWNLLRCYLLCALAEYFVLFHFVFYLICAFRSIDSYASNEIVFCTFVNFFTKHGRSAIFPFFSFTRTFYKTLFTAVIIIIFFLFISFIYRLCLTIFINRNGVEKSKQ